MGLNVQDFDTYKDTYVEILKSYELYENEDDLSSIWIDRRSVLEILEIQNVRSMR